MIAQSGVPVVPVYVSGSGSALPKGKGIKLGSLLRVFIGRAISPDSIKIKTSSGKTDYEAITTVVMKGIAELKAHAVSTGEHV